MPPLITVDPAHAPAFGEQHRRRPEREPQPGVPVQRPKCSSRVGVARLGRVVAALFEHHDVDAGLG
jgi:hypothetical protein